jgi:hypothetical protein
MSESYDVQQICENGHKVTGCYSIRAEERQDFCQKCGARTIIACPNCKKEIQGDRVGTDWNGNLNRLESARVPSFCRNCGEPYPWTKNKIMTAIQILTEFGNLDEKEKETIEEDIANIAKDTPQAELSARRIKRIWEKCKMAGYEIIMEFASRTAAKILKNP